MSKESLVFSEVFRELDHLVVSIMIPPLSLHSFLFFSKFGYKCGIERVELNMCVGSIPAQFDAGANKSDVGNLLREVKTCIALRKEVLLAGYSSSYICTFRPI